MKVYVRVLIWVGCTAVLIVLLYFPVPFMSVPLQPEIPRWEKAAIVVLSPEQSSPPAVEERPKDGAGEVFDKLEQPNHVEEQSTFDEQVLEEELPVSALVTTKAENETVKDLQTLEGYYQVVDAVNPPIFDVAVLQKRLIYPPLARRQAKEGVVVVRLFISSSGLIDRVLVEDDPGYGFASATVIAFEGLHIIPATLNGKPIPVTMLYPIRFTLK